MQNSEKHVTSSDTLVGGGQDFTAETFSGTVDTPCVDKMWPKKVIRCGRTRHFSGFTFNPASSVRLRARSNDSQCLAKVRLKMKTSSKNAKSSSHVIQANKLAIWCTKNGTALQSPNGTRFHCQCPGREFCFLSVVWMNFKRMISRD